MVLLSSPPSPCAAVAQRIPCSSSRGGSRPSLTKRTKLLLGWPWPKTPPSSEAAQSDACPGCDSVRLPWQAVALLGHLLPGSKKTL